MFPRRTSHSPRRSGSLQDLHRNRKLFVFNFVRPSCSKYLIFFFNKFFWSSADTPGSVSENTKPSHTAAYLYIIMRAESDDGHYTYSCLRVFTHNTKWVTHYNNSILIIYAFYIIHISLLYCYNIVIGVEIIIIEQWERWHYILYFIL